MKLTRIFALALAGIMLALSLASCGAAVPEINVTVKIVADDPENPILDVTVPIKSEAPTVLEAVQEALIVNEISYTLSEDGASILDIQDYKDTTVDGLTYYWMYYLNGEEPTSGKANANAIADGDVIEYNYVMFDPAAKK